MKHDDSKLFAKREDRSISEHLAIDYDRPHLSSNSTERRNLQPFLASKRVFDIIMSLVLLPAMLSSVAIVACLNPIWNRGPLFFVQIRMGRDCKPFKAIKLRTMKPASDISRGADCPLEESRITPLGRLLRTSRFDELPQILNVLKGDMSLIGPRPDYFEHAEYFLTNVPGYRERHAVRPGISGLAQIEGMSRLMLKL